MPYGKCTYKDQTNETAPIACAALPSVFSDARPPEVCTLQWPAYTCVNVGLTSPVSGSVAASPGRTTVHSSVMSDSAFSRARSNTEAVSIGGAFQRGLL